MDRFTVITLAVGLAVVGGVLYFGGILGDSDVLGGGDDKAGWSLDSNGQRIGDDSCDEVVCLPVETPAPVVPVPVEVAPGVAPSECGQYTADCGAGAQRQAELTPAPTPCPPGYTQGEVSCFQ